MNDAEIGVNVPPLHPFCRSVIIPAYENEDRASRTRWVRNPITGKGMKVPADMSYDEWYKKYVENALNHGIINIRGMANGLRQSPFRMLSENEIVSLKADAESIGIPLEVLRFNKGSKTGFLDNLKLINIRGDVLPDLNGNSPRDLMSSKAVLAHEYYGHYANHPSLFRNGDWRDEFRASYCAAVNAPNLSDSDRRDLMLDAYDRAREAGIAVIYNKNARRIIYGYDIE